MPNFEPTFESLARPTCPDWFQDAKFGIWSQWKGNKSCDQYGPYAGVPYDGNDEAYRDFYSDNREHLERSQLPEINPRPWQTDTCIGGWFYDVRATRKKPAHLIEMLIDIVAKNGCMLIDGRTWCRPVAT